MTIQKIVNDPSLVKSSFSLKGKEEIIFRPLIKEDFVPFGIFLDSLSEETKARFGPHPINSIEAKNICKNLNYLKMLPMVLTNQKDEVIGYIILSFQFRDSQLLRYKAYTIPIVKDQDICIAPVVADSYQNKGLGSVMLGKTIEIAKLLGVRHVILWQGTQLSNTRAIHLYEKFGFKRNSEFEIYGNMSVDMSLGLE